MENKEDYEKINNIQNKNNFIKNFTFLQVLKIFKKNITILIFLYILNEMSIIFSPYLMSRSLGAIENFYKGIYSINEVLKVNIVNTIIWSVWIFISAIVKINGGILFNKIEIYIKQQLFIFLQSIPYENFVKITAEKAFNYLKTMEYSIKEIFSIIIVDMFANTFSICVNIFLLFRVIPQLGLIIIIWFLLHLLLLLLIFKKMISLNKKFMTTKSQLMNNLLESLLNTLMTKTNNTLDYEKKKLKDLSENYAKINKEFLFTSEKFNALTLIICEILLWTGSFIIILNYIKTNYLSIATITYLFMVIYNVVHKIKNIGVKITKLFEYLGEYKTMNNFFENYKIHERSSCNLFQIKQDNTKYKTIDEVPIIEFENVNLFYEDNQILKDINFKIYKGEKVCFIGSSGSGKSTIVNLLCGIYRNYTGNIYINGYNISQVRSKDIIEFVSIVNQNYILFTRTVKENLIQNKLISQDKIIHYCKITAIDEFINNQLEKKYDTIINGKTISGGQAQRICLARMLLREKSIKIFDEATNGLDIQNKQFFLENILDNKYYYQNNSQDTLLFVDHSLEFLDKMSKVILLKHGEIICNGSYNEIKNHPLFLHLQNNFLDY